MISVNKMLAKVSILNQKLSYVCTASSIETMLIPNDDIPNLTRKARFHRMITSLNFRTIFLFVSFR